MEGKKYQELAMRTRPKDLGKDEMLINAALGVAGESGEFADILKKWQFQGHDKDEAHLAKELGDILWYVAMGCEGLGINMDDVMGLNIAKLKNRYPNGFDSELSQHRAKGDI